jgi:hypothetical protein
MLYVYKVGPTFHQGPRFSKGIDNISMRSTDRGMRLRSVQQKSGLRYCYKIISAWSAPVGAIRERLNENGRLKKNSRLESCRGEDKELNIIERHTSLIRVQSCHRRRRPPVTHSGRHDYHQRDWTPDIRPESMRELFRTCGHAWRRHRFEVNRSRTSNEFRSHIGG